MLELLNDGNGHKTYTSTLTVNGQRTYSTGISSRFAKSKLAVAAKVS